MPKKYIYLDHASATPIRPEVQQEIIKSQKLFFGNPNSLHSIGRVSYDALKIATKKIANLLECRESEVILTSGATESNNLAILGSIDRKTIKKTHLITSIAEHPSVLEVFKNLEKDGADITYLPINNKGQIRINELEKSIKKNTVLVSVIASNHEIGAINPISKITKLVKKINPNTKVHTDASQYAPWHKFNIAKLGADLITISASKMGGPQGVGILIAKDTIILPIMWGGNQQQGKRPGTENLIGAIATAKALELNFRTIDKDTFRVKNLRKLLKDLILKNFPLAFANSPDNSQPNLLSITFPGVRATDLVYALDVKGVEASTGSACQEKSINESKRILNALGLSKENQFSTVRFSIGKQTKKTEIIKSAKIILDTALEIKKDTLHLNQLDKIGKKIAKNYAQK